MLNELVNLLQKFVLSKLQNPTKAKVSDMSMNMSAEKLVKQALNKV